LRRDARFFTRDIEGCVDAISRVGSGGLSVLIDSNTLDCRLGITNLHNGCIDMFLPGTSMPGTISNNVIMGDAGVIRTQATGVTYTNNVCKVSASACNACVSAGQCVASGTVAIESS